MRLSNFSLRYEIRPVHIIRNSPVNRQGEWSGDAIVAWSVTKDSQIDNLQRDEFSVARAWLNSEFRAWSKSVAKPTRKAMGKDYNGNITTDLPNTKNPLKEL